MHSVLNEASIFDTISNVAATFKSIYDNKKIDPKNPAQTQYMKGSVSRYTKDLVMTFPVLSDTTLSMNTLQLINKAHERHICDLMQMLFASMSISGANGREALRSIHKNIDGMGMDEIIDALNGDAGLIESAQLNAEIRDALKEMTENLRSGNAYKTFPSESLNEKSLNIYRVKDDGYHQMMVYEDYKDYEIQMKMEKDKRDAEETKNKNAIALLQNRIVPGDIKKANDLQPTLMVVNVNVANPNGGFEKIPIICGIKARLIAVESMDIIERLVSKNKSDLSLKNLIRATTGEIRFARDFIMNIKQAKINAKNAVKKGPAAKMWDVLEKRSIQQNAAKIAKYGNDGSSIAALVINQETVNYLKSQFNINLENPAAAKMFMNAYCLLALIIADDVNEVAKFMYDGNDTFEVQSYVALSKEAADKAYKKLVNLINNGGR